MRYLSGPLALAVPSDLDVAFEWRFGKSEWTDDNINGWLRESENSPFGSWGIQENVFLDYRPLHLWNVANHLRVYCDMVAELRFDELKGMFDSYICKGTYRRDIFEAVMMNLLDSDSYKDINEFFFNEFGNAWVSWNDAVISQAKRARKIICKNPTDIPKEDISDIFQSLRNPKV